MSDNAQAKFDEDPLEPLDGDGIGDDPLEMFDDPFEEFQKNHLGLVDEGVDDEDMWVSENVRPREGN